MKEIEELVARLREEADWAFANEWEIPLMLPVDLRRAASVIEWLMEDKEAADGKEK